MLCAGHFTAQMLNCCSAQLFVQLSKEQQKRKSQTSSLLASAVYTISLFFLS